MTSTKLAQAQRMREYGMHSSTSPKSSASDEPLCTDTSSRYAHFQPGGSTDASPGSPRSSTSFALGVSHQRRIYFFIHTGNASTIHSSPAFQYHFDAMPPPRSVVIQLAGVLFIVVHGRFSLSFSWPTSIPTTPNDEALRVEPPHHGVNVRYLPR